MRPEHAELSETVRIDCARILATLIRTVGDFAVAEDAVAEATLAALQDWPTHGVPSQPRAWLTLTAKRKAIDILRRESARATKERDASALMELSRTEREDEASIRDDQLRLMFICCHPALAPQSQVALALRTLCGLTVEQIAAVLMSTPAATAKQLTRVRSKIATAGIPYVLPGPAELPVRLAAVCAVIAAAYTAGHAPIDGEAGVDVDACAEAIRLARLLHELLPEQTLPAGLLAMLLFTESRRPARLDGNGEIVLLAEQDRSAWDAELIRQAREVLNRSLEQTGGVADPYQLQAAIAAEHARAVRAEETNWAEIVRLYELLVRVAPSPAGQLAHAVAVSEVSGPGAALRLLEGIEASSRLHAVRAELLSRSGRHREAVAAAELSITGPMTEPERRFRHRRLLQLQQPDGPDRGGRAGGA